MIPNLPNGETEESCVESAQKLYDTLRAKNYSGEILNNAHQLLKKVQNESTELSNVDHRDEEPSDDKYNEGDDTEEAPSSEHLDKDAEDLEDISEDIEDMQERDEDEEEESDEEELPNYEDMSKEEMGKDLQQRGIIKIIIS